MEAELLKKCLKTDFEHHFRTLNLDEPKIDTKVWLVGLNYDEDGAMSSYIIRETKRRPHGDPWDSMVSWVWWNSFWISPAEKAMSRSCWKCQVSADSKETIVVQIRKKELGSTFPHIPYPLPLPTLRSHSFLPSLYMINAVVLWLPSTEVLMFQFISAMQINT